MAALLRCPGRSLGARDDPGPRSTASYRGVARLDFAGALRREACGGRRPLRFTAQSVAPLAQLVAPLSPGGRKVTTDRERRHHLLDFSDIFLCVLRGTVTPPFLLSPENVRACPCEARRGRILHEEPPPQAARGMGSDGTSRETASQAELGSIHASGDLTFRFCGAGQPAAGALRRGGISKHASITAHFRCKHNPPLLL